MFDKVKKFLYIHQDEIIAAAAGFVAGAIVMGISNRNRRVESVWMSIDPETEKMNGYDVVLKNGTKLPFHTPIDLNGWPKVQGHDIVSLEGVA